MRRVIWELFKMCPDAASAAQADVAAIERLIYPLGLATKRAAMVIRFSREYLDTEVSLPKKQAMLRGISGGSVLCSAWPYSPLLCIRCWLYACSGRHVGAGAEVTESTLKYACVRAPIGEALRALAVIASRKQSHVCLNVLCPASHPHQVREHTGHVSQHSGHSAWFLP